MVFDRYTESARRVIQHARKEAEQFNHNYLGTEHLLLGLIRETDSIACTVLHKLNLNLDIIRNKVLTKMSIRGTTISIGEIPFTLGAKKVLEFAMHEARVLRHAHVGTEHILLGLLRESSGIAAEVLRELRVDPLLTKKYILDILDKDTEKKPKKSQTPSLDEFGRDLTKLAMADKLDPVIGRDDEIERVIQILSRRTKNNPVLIGEPGVGKTAIAEGLAQKIVNHEVPEILFNKRLVTLDLGAIVAGTKYRGQFEERLKAVMKEITTTRNIILFVDELHTLIGAGSAEGSIDASNMLKPSLSRGEIQCLGATTLDEYRKYIEKDGALERRFQTIMVDPPSVDQTVEILKGLREKYEKHHNARIDDEALTTAVDLANQYICDRFLPDKAIDVIDEAGSRARLQSMILPEELRELQNEIKLISQEKRLKVKEQEFEHAARLRDQEQRLKEKYEKEKEQWKWSRIHNKVSVSREDVEYIVSRWTRIPVNKLEEKESEKLFKIEDELHKRVVGQNSAVSAVAKAIRRSRAGLKDPKRNIGSFIFLGPSGVGKTELARSLAFVLFNDDQALIRLDMSEFSEQFTVSKMIGSAPGYVGYGEGGQLTEQIRRRPYSVILLDEIEKAHPDVFNILLQVLEDGRLTDSLGRVVDFKNTVLIMTSNLGARLINKGTTMGFQSSDSAEDFKQMKDLIIEESKRVFNPEFINRIDELVVFHNLDKDQMFNILTLFIQRINKNLENKNIKLLVDDDVKSFIIDKEFNPVEGARPIRRAVQKYIENNLADALLDGKLKDATKLKVFLRNNEILFLNVDEPEEVPFGDQKR